MPPPRPRPRPLLLAGTAIIVRIDSGTYERIRGASFTKTAAVVRIMHNGDTVGTTKNDLTLQPTCSTDGAAAIPIIKTARSPPSGTGPSCHGCWEHQRRTGSPRTNCSYLTYCITSTSPSPSTTTTTAFRGRSTTTRESCSFSAGPVRRRFFRSRLCLRAARPAARLLASAL